MKHLVNTVVAIRLVYARAYIIFGPLSVSVTRPSLLLVFAQRGVLCISLEKTQSLCHAEITVNRGNCCL